ncbi:MAG: dihydrodipicolinate synthase family protein [Bryobacterales bacterium]|jgi:4-hydroxy-tetrahydrodipicolinate synthase|nr:dihydrodipicolinate synthase family protein [Bryobacterales bacterium]
MQARLKGIFTPMLVPLDQRGDIHEAELRRFINWLIASGVHGLYPNGSTGEFTRLTVEERQRIVRITCEEVQGRVPILAGAAEANVRETIAACELYHSFGATAVAIVSPFYYRLSAESVYAHFREIALHSPIDVTLYNIPMFASPIDVPTIQRLAEFEKIVGIKDSSGDVAFMMRMIAAVRPLRPDFTFLTGWDCVLVPMLVAGADGGTNAASNVAPELLRRLFDLASTGNLQPAMELQRRILELFDLMLYRFEFPDGFRAGVEMRGFDFGRSRQPQTTSQIAERAKLKDMLQCLVADVGLAAQPPGGCRFSPTHEPLPPLGSPSANPDLQQVVSQVLDALKQKGLL